MRAKMPLRPIGAPEEEAKPTTQAKDLSDLSWSEKEKVLRVLFAKINGTSLAKAAEKADRLREQMSELRKPMEQRLGSGFARDAEQRANASRESNQDYRATASRERYAEQTPHTDNFSEPIGETVLSS